MELWQSLLVAFGGNAALLLVLGFLGRSLARTVIEKDLASFKAKLELAAIEHQVRFSTLHEKRAAVLAEMYALLVRAARQAEAFAFPLRETGAGKPTHNERFVATLNAINDYLRFLDEHRVYVSERLAGLLEGFGKQLKGIAIPLGVTLQWEHPNEETIRERLKVWPEAWKAAEHEVPKSRAALELELRALLGVGDDRPI